MVRFLRPCHIIIINTSCISLYIARQSINLANAWVIHNIASSVHKLLLRFYNDDLLILTYCTWSPKHKVLSSIDIEDTITDDIIDGCYTEEKTIWYKNRPAIIVINPELPVCM